LEVGFRFPSGKDIFSFSITSWISLGPIQNHGIYHRNQRSRSLKQIHFRLVPKFRILGFFFFLGSTALGPRLLFQFPNPIHSWQDSLDGWPARRKNLDSYMQEFVSPSWRSAFQLSPLFLQLMAPSFRIYLLTYWGELLWIR
jgi:hypothetical protein